MHLKLAEALEHVLVSWAAITNDHKFGQHKTSEMYYLPYWSPEIWCWQGVGSLQGL